MPATAALLLTDLVDSTKLSEQLGDTAMARLWAAHDRVARDLLVVHRGREIDKTDGFLLLFEAAADAVAYALAYHRALTRLDPPVQARAGLHVGPVILTENNPADVARGAKPLEVDGLAKPTAARIMSVAIGGQTLVSQAALEALGDTPHRVDAHGHWRMKGVLEPLALFEVGDDQAPFTPPPDGAKVYRVVRQGQHWLPVREVRHHLPAERDAFVGRGADLRALADLLDRSRLVSVLGMGGSGKTRLVTRFAWTWLGDFPGGAWFCDLSEARSVEGICGAVAKALDVPLGKDDPVVQLGHAIAGHGECLVVLDNFEQVAPHAADTVGRWLDRASKARFVVTTREILGLPGETALPLAPLVQDDSVSLFVARARQANPDFTDDDAASIPSLVALLDGLPLAIELAAARVRVMPPKTLLARMSQRFKLLSSSGGRPTRQATLRATFEWSWDLLSEDERSALAQLSVFEGGFTLEGAEGVLSLSAMWAVDAVQALVDRSWVRPVSDNRFDLLVSVQEYAAEKLDASGGRAEAEARHVATFAALGSDEALAALGRHGGVALLRGLVAELDNLVVATRRATARGEVEQAVATLRAASEVLALKGPAAVAVALAEAVCALPGLSPRLRGQAALRLGNALRTVGRGNEGLVSLERALAATREAGDRRTEGSVLGSLGFLHAEQGRNDEARAHYEQALAVHREVGNRRDEGGVLGNLGLQHADQGRMDEARALYASGLAIHREVGDRRAEGNALTNLGILHADQGQLDAAMSYYETSLAVHREVGNRRSEGNVLANLGTIHWQQGRLEATRAHLDAALAVHREVGNRRSEGIVLANLGILHSDQGRLDEASTHFHAALNVQREAGNRRAEGWVLLNLGALHRDQGRLDEARAHLDAALAANREVGDRRYEGIVLGNLGHLQRELGRPDEARAHYDAGATLLRAVGDQHELARLLCGRALLSHAAAQPEEARRDLTEAGSLAVAVGAGPDSELGQALAKARAALEAA